MPYELDDFRSVISQKKQTQKYDELEAECGVNRYYLWHIINDPEYEPPAWVCAKLGIAKYEPAPVCPIHGIVERYDCQTQRVTRKYAPRTGWTDLWSIPEGELRDMIENRQELRWT